MRISAIVPTRNSQRTLAACLESLRAQTHSETQVIVVDNNSTDDTQLIARDTAHLTISQGPERSAQRNRGATEASGEILVFFDSDMVIEPTVLAEIARTFEHNPEVGAITIPERSFGEGFLAQCRVQEKGLYVGNDEVEAPRAFRKEVFAAVGGWDETLTAAEDWDLADRTRAQHVPIARIDAWIWHDEGRIDLGAQFHKKQYYGRWVAEYLSRSPEARKHVTRTSVVKKMAPMWRHPVLTGGMLALKSVETAGLAKGMYRARKAGLVGAGS